jgi:lysophospholipase L1-like esterase
MPLYRIIAIGDSLTYGYPFGKPLSWVEQASQALGIQILNQGVNGNSLKEILRRLTIDVLDLSPEYCIVMAGANDVYQGYDLELMKANLMKITERLTEYKIIPILGIPPPILNKVHEKKMIKFRSWLKTFARKNKFKVIDFYASFLDSKKKRVVKSNLDDEVHPSLAGYQTMTRAAIKVMQPLR